jgi:hypothetical protein
MCRRPLTVILIVTVPFLSFLSVANISISSRGTWPDSWPEELELYRNQAKTMDVGTFPMDRREIIHEISFATHEDFRKAWPHILKVRSPGAPIFIERGPSTVWSSTIQAGVRIFCPSDGVLIQTPDGQQQIGSPPWPDYIGSEFDVVPEYLVHHEDKYTPFEGTYRAGHVFRARVDIVLIVDGKVVDLNRIPLPADTLVVDRRFTKEGS